MSFSTFATNPEAFDADFSELNELLELSVQHTVETFEQASERETAELRQLADDIEAIDEELAERLRETADHNPLSETAVDLKLEAYDLL